MKIKIIIITLICINFSILNVHSDESELNEYRGVVTLYLIPAKVIKINKIIENPKPGTSYIGDESILVEVEEELNVMANWTVVNIKYYKFTKPKIIKYEIFSKQNEIAVNFHAVEVVKDGDLSSYIQE